jgi:hypothetical protein
MDDSQNDGAGGFGGDEEVTPVNPRRAASPEATALRNIGLTLNTLAQHFREAALLVDERESDDRRHALVGLEEQVGELAEIAHDARRVISECRGD